MEERAGASGCIWQLEGLMVTYSLLVQALAQSRVPD